MSNYQTNNPVPSIDPRDLDDNATIFDRLLNETVATVPDRLLVPRKTWWQMEQDAAALVSPNVSALASLTGAANRLPYFTGAGAMSLTTLTAVARSLLDDADAAAMLATLGIPWAGATTAINATDLNTVTNTCVLGISSGTLNVPVGAASGSMALTLVYSSSNMQQIVTSRTADQVFFRRNSASTWQPWVSFVMSGVNSTITSLTGLTTALSVAQGGTGVTTVAALLTALVAAGAYSKTSILGTVSQSAGVPTGAAFETGGTLSGTGKYFKYADGRMTIIKSLAIGTGSTTAKGSIFGSAAVSAGNFPVAFVGDTPIVQHSGTDVVGGGWTATEVFPTLTTWGSYSTRAHVSQGASGTIYLTAEGRWF